MKRSFSILLILGIMVSGSTMAQNANEVFGKNRVQTKSIDWKVFISENFEIYYYEGGQKHAQFATEYSESKFDEISDLLGFTPYSRIRLFIYNSISDLRQSNIDYMIQYYRAGGETQFVNHSVEIAFPGTNADFMEEIKFGMAKTLINEMMYGGSFKDVISSSYLLSLPEWFTEGAAAYAAKGWSIEMDDHVRDLYASGKVKTLNGMTGRDARFLGQSMWNYIAVQYGKNNIGSILNLTRILRNPENSITNTIGIPFQAFYRDWQQYYYSMTAHVLDRAVMPEDEDKIINKNRKALRFNDMRISPDGNYLAYTVNNSGRSQVIIKDLISQKSKVVYKSGYRFNEEKVNYNLPILAWQNSDNLNIVDVSNNRLKRITYKMSTKKSSKSRGFRFQNIQDISFNQNGSMVAISAESFGQVDIYMMNIRSGNMRRITNDHFDDVNPRFIPGTKKIIFSSNRTTDTLRVKQKDKVLLSDNFNLYLFDENDSRWAVEKLTNNYFQNLQPRPINEKELLYLSDINGILNLYHLDLESGSARQISDYQQNIHFFDYHPSSGKLAFRMNNGGSELIYLIPRFDLEQTYAEHETFRNTWIVEGKNFGIAQEEISRDYILDFLNQAGEKEPEVPSLDAIDPDNINLDDIIFESEKKEKSLSQKKEEKEKAQSESDILSLLEKNEEYTIDIMGPYKGQNRLRAENIITALVCDNLRGLGGVVEYGLSDMFGDHKFKLGATIYFDLKSSDYYAEYQYLKHRLDYKVRYDRKTIFRQLNEQSSVFHRYTLNSGEVAVSLPLTEAFRVSFAPFYAHTEYSNITIMPASDFTQPYLGYKVEAVFDNSTELDINQSSGTKIKAVYKDYQALQNSMESFKQFSFEIRNYFPIYRELVLATRLSYGRFFGNSPKTYMLGGTDNWFITQDTEAQGPLEELDVNNALFDNTDLLFAEFSTALRGFPLNTAFGEEYALLNIELRFPVFQFLSNKPISSTFFRNMQLIGFYDIGSAWTGASPFNNENSFNTELIDANSIRIKTRNYINPYLMGYGFGVRSTVFGYYVKYDVGWGVENYTQQEPVHHVTLGYDF